MKRYLFLLTACGMCLSLIGCDDNYLMQVSGNNDTVDDEFDDENDYLKDSDEDPDNQNTKKDNTKKEGECDNGATLCRGECIDLEEMHMDDCRSCSLNYCNADNDLSNGCETYVFGTDVNNCGGCAIQCDTGETCVDGDCITPCEEGQLKCGDACISLSEKHLESCSSCAADYCDSDSNLENGCEINAKGDDVNNCGACGNKCDEGEICSNGECRLDCASNETLCNGKCTDLNKLHLSACGACAADYCDSDSNLENGCEINAKGDDVNNCGACGNKCQDGQVCSDGACKSAYNAHRIFLVALGGDTLNLRESPVSGRVLKEIPEFTYLTVTDEKDMGNDDIWLKVSYDGETGWISGCYYISAGDEYQGRKAIDEAEKYLYTDHPGYCTRDLLKDSPNFTDLIGWSDVEYNYGYNDNCANFVTAMLKTVGMISKNLLGVSDIFNHCDGANGYRRANFSEAKPGDIWMNSSLGHTELVMGYHARTSQLVLIGSNNFGDNNDYYTYGGCQMQTGQGSGSYQRVSYAYKDSGYMFTRQ